jgi:hypothetical protein
MAQLNFNAATVAPSTGFDVIPAGNYNVRITGSEMKPTKDGSGSYLSLTLTVADGPFANRKLFDRLNLNNKNKVTVDIAYQTLSAICHATGVIQLQDSTQLHGILLSCKVKVKPAEGKYDEGNEISSYKAADGAVTCQPAAPAWVAPAAPAPQPPAQPAWVAPVGNAAPQAPAAPPWAK